MRPSSMLAILLALAFLIAGCLGGGDEDDEEQDPGPVVRATWAEDALPTEEGHDHLDAAQHANRSTPNFAVVGWDPLITEHHGRTSGSYLCGDVSEEGDQKIGVVHSHLSDVAFVVVDVTDPTAPRMIGELVTPNTFIYDVAITPDARFVAMATSDPAAEDEPPVKRAMQPAPYGDMPYFRDCNGATRPVQGPLDQAPFSSGVVLVDLEDPTAPAITDYTPMALLGAHSVFATQIEGTYWILGAATNLEHHGSFFQFITIETLPTLGPKMVVQSTYRPAPPTEGEQPRINGHVDGWIQKHPVSGTTVGYLADWDGGLVLVDLTDPKAPEETGRWTNYAGHQPTSLFGDDSGSIHSAVPMTTTWDGKHYTIIGQEVIGRPTDTPTGMTWVMDTTDITDPHPVSGWTLPVDPLWGDTLMFSTHYPTVDEESRTMFVTMYHGGVWAVDLTNITEPRTAGVFLPDRVSPEPAGDLHPVYNWAPTVLEAEVIGNGTLLVWDAGSGVYLVDWDPTVEVPRVDEWEIKSPGA